MTAPTLFNHQVEDIQFSTTNPRVLNFSDCGTGKTAVAIHTTLARKHEGRTLVICPKSIMHAAWGTDLQKFAPRLRVSYAYAENRKEAFEAATDIVIINHDGVKWIAEQLKAKNPILRGFCQLIIDECFPAGTMISTPSGQQDIKLVKRGDLVYNSAGISTVTRTFSRATTSLVRLTLSDGRTIVCTPNHPIATKKGWTPSGNTKHMRVVLEPIHIKSMVPTFLRKNVRKTAHARNNERRKETSPSKENIGLSTWPHSLEQRDSLSPKNQSVTKPNSNNQWPQTTNTWREWTYSTLRSLNPRNAITRLANELRNLYETTKGIRLPLFVQSGLRLARKEMDFGDRRKLPPSAKTPRHQTGLLFGNVRVEDIQNIELDRPITVYNLEVNGNPDYFANGVLVHNCTAFKNHSQRSVAAMAIRVFFKYRMVMTGTPYTESLLDVWRQVFIVDDGDRLGKSFYKYRSEVAYQIPMGNGACTWKDKPGMDAIIRDRLKSITIRRRLEDCIDIPERTTIEVPTVLNPKHRKIYEILQHTSILQLEAGQVTAFNAAVLANKLLQLSSGAVYTTDGNYEKIDNDRYELIAELARQRPKSIIAFNWRHQKEILQTLLPEALIIDGSISQNDRQRAVEAFQTGTCPILLIHPKAGAHGLTLTAGYDTIWASPTYSTEQFIQFNHRLYRAGQTKKTRIILIAAQNTIEPAVYDLLQGKLNSAMSLLQLFTEVKKDHDND